MQSIYLVTHPQAEHHVAGLVGGWYDSDLTELGCRQAEAIAAELERRHDGGPLGVVTSDLKRAGTPPRSSPTDWASTSDSTRTCERSPTE
nr:phosphoglycerate mutase family protein [Microlunatus soli]